MTRTSPSTRRVAKSTLLLRQLTDTAVHGPPPYSTKSVKSYFVYRTSYLDLPTFSNMNFLAHLYLSGDNPRLMVGNFIGDFVKGRNAVEKFDPEIARGIQLHRSIDAFTDTHPVVTRSKNRLRPKYRHYAGVIVDVFYDHFLASNWNLYHTEPLPSYAARVYHLIQGFEPILPQDVKYMLPYMVSGNWLVNYAQLEGIHRALSGMARRTPFTSKMEEAVHDLKANFDDFRKEFDAFFPELTAYCKAKIEKSGP